MMVPSDPVIVLKGEEIQIITRPPEKRKRPLSNAPPKSPSERSLTPRSLTRTTTVPQQLSSTPDEILKLFPSSPLNHPDSTTTTAQPLLPPPAIEIERDTPQPSGAENPSLSGTSFPWNC
jgi:hypothetical protein